MHTLLRKIVVEANYLIEEGTKAIADFKAKSLSLGGLVNRLESIKDALADRGIGLGETVDDELLQLEIINGLIASGDQVAPSDQDLVDIDSYLRHIGDELLEAYQADSN